MELLFIIPIVIIKLIVESTEVRRADKYATFLYGK